MALAMVRSLEGGRWEQVLGKLRVRLELEGRNHWSISDQSRGGRKSDFHGGYALREGNNDKLMSLWMRFLTRLHFLTRSADSIESSSDCSARRQLGHHLRRRSHLERRQSGSL